MKPRAVTAYAYHDERGTVLYENVRYEPKDFRLRRRSGDVVSWNLRGVRRVPYRLPQLLAAIERGETLWVTEGEKDADALAAFDLRATTSAMGCGWKWTHEFVGYFEGAKRIVVVTDCDDPGRKAARSRAQLLTLICNHVLVFDLAPERHDGYDVSDWLGEGHGVSELLSGVDRSFARPRLLPQNNPASDASNGKKADKERRVLTQASSASKARKSVEQPPPLPALAASQDILSDLVSDAKLANVVGENRIVKLLFLALVSRHQDRPVSLAVKAASAAGKSYVVGKVLDFFTPDAYYAFTAMSERALLYGEGSLEHKMLILYETAGLSNDLQTYLVRSLLSEGHLKYPTVEKHKGKMRERVIERRGPTGLITTTTAIRLHPENETRLLAVPMNESQEQTKDVMRAAALIARDVSGGAETPQFLRRWHEFDAWLTQAQHRAVIPFAGELVEEIDPVALRLRRDVNILFALLKAHAILHQQTRERDEHGRIVATIDDDYRPVYEIVSDLFAEGVELRVSGTIRETVQAVIGLTTGGSSTTVRSIASKLRLDRSTVGRRVHRALDLGYLREVGHAKARGSPLQVEAGEPLPNTQVEVLPTPRRLMDAVSPAAEERIDADLTQAAVHQNGPVLIGEKPFDAFYAPTSGESEGSEPDELTRPRDDLAHAKEERQIVDDEIVEGVL